VTSRDQGQDVCRHTGPAQEGGRFGPNEGTRSSSTTAGGGGCRCMTMISRFVRVRVFYDLGLASSVQNVIYTYYTYTILYIIKVVVGRSAAGEELALSLYL